jgi:hypothetical protein
MINLIYNHDNAFDAIVYGEQHPANLEFFRQQTRGLSETLTDAGRNFFSNVQQLHEQFNGSEAIRLAKAAVRASKSLFKPNIVSGIFDMGEMQQAQPIMQRFIMANPVVRQMYHDQRCDGYGDTYVDMQPNKIGEDHYDYRRVMHGMVQESQEYDWTATFHMDELHDGDKHLTMDEQVDILQTWEIVEMFLAKGDEDPTSPFNNSL